MTDFGNFMTSINGIPNDGVNHTYWTILIGPERESASTGEFNLHNLKANTKTKMLSN